MEPQNPLYAAVIDSWYNKHRLRIAESTAYNYRKALPLLKSYFDNIKVRDITPVMVYDFVQAMIRKFTAKSSARLYCKILNMSLRYAVACGYIYYNPVDDVALPKRERTEITPFKIHEVYALMDSNGPQWVKDGIMIAFRTGMRPGEIYALKWSDVDLSLGCISVQRAISRACSAAKTTKTPSGVRRIDIDHKLISYLSKMPSRGTSQYVFPATPFGRHEYRVPWNLAKELKDMCRSIGIPERNFYALRHTHATILLELGIHPKVVQERLGHSTIDITLNIYSHITPTIQAQAVKKLEQI